MVLSARASSSAPVTTRRSSRMRDHFLIRSGLAQSAGVAKKSFRCTLSSGKRAVQASSMVKQRMGANQVTMRRKISSVTVRVALRRAACAGSQ